MNISGFVTKLFETHLDRQPNKNELNIHIDRFKFIYGYDQEKITNEFINCPERQHILCNKQTYFNGVGVLCQFKKNYIGDNISSFNPIICVEEKTKNKIINSNSYLLLSERQRYDPEIGASRGYENTYNIYRAIENNYKEITTKDYDYLVDDECVYFCNAFMDSNIGHSCAHNFLILENYFRNNQKLPTKIVIIDDILPNMLKLLLIFFTESQLISLKRDKIYKFTNITIPFPHIFGLENAQITASKILDYCGTFYNDDSLKNQKIIMIKTKSADTQTISSYFVQNLTPDMINYCRSNNILIIEPANYCIYKLISMLKNASVILTSGGAISYNHMIYFNRSARLYFVGSQYIYSGMLPFRYIPYLDLTNLQNMFSVV